MPPLAFISDDKIEKCYIQMTVILVAKIGDQVMLAFQESRQRTDVGTLREWSQGVCRRR
jgi:hypothetical protein